MAKHYNPNRDKNGQFATGSATPANPADRELTAPLIQQKHEAETALTAGNISKTEYFRIYTELFQAGLPLSEPPRYGRPGGITEEEYIQHLKEREAVTLAKEMFPQGPERTAALAQLGIHAPHPAGTFTEFDPQYYESLDGTAKGIVSREAYLSSRGNLLARGTHRRAYPRKTSPAETTTEQTTEETNQTEDPTSVAWQDQPMKVEGRSFTLGQVSGGKLYHGSPTELPVGTLLEPGHGTNYKQSSPTDVSITSNAHRARTWVTEDSAASYVYEIEPLGPVAQWRTGLAEYGESFHLWEGRVGSARITRIVTADEL